MDLPPVPDSVPSKAKLCFLELSPKSLNKPKSLKSFLTPLTETLHVAPWCLFSLVLMSGKFNWFNYGSVAAEFGLVSVVTADVLFLLQDPA